VAPPVDWTAGVAAADLLFSACSPGAFNAPNLGNGFLAWKTGPNCDGGPCVSNACVLIFSAPATETSLWF